MEVAEDETPATPASMDSHVGTGNMPPDKMADAIRRAREQNPGTGEHDVVFEDAEPEPAEMAPNLPPPPVALPSELHPRTEDAGYDTAEARAVIDAAAKELAAGKRRVKWLMVALPLSVAVTLATLLVILMAGPTMIQTTFPVETAPLESHSSNTSALIIEQIPEPVVEEPEPEPEPERRRSRDRSRSRDRNREAQIDENDLF